MPKLAKRKRRHSPLQRYFTQVSDPRSKQGRRHSLSSILALFFTATAAGVQGPIGIAEYGRQLPPRASKRLGCRKDKQTGAYTSPSANTIRSAISALDTVELSKLLCETLQVEQAVAVVAVDGKTLRGSRRAHQKAKAVLSALDVNTGLVLAQREITEEHLEIPEFCPLLAPLPLAGVVVTADAMHTQTAHAKFLVEEKQADFLFVVKGNQGSLFGELNRWPNDAFGAPHTTVDKAHGRVETRTIEVGEVGSRHLPFPHVQQIFRMQRTCQILTTGDTREGSALGLLPWPQIKPTLVGCKR